MVWPFTKQTKSFLGVDIGTSSIRVVELSKYGEQEKLESYGHLFLSPFSSDSLKIFEKGNVVLSPKYLAELIVSIINESKIKTKRVAFSIPDFSTLFTTFTLPPMAEDELAQAVQFEARRYVPLPLSEVTLDWMITKGSSHNVDKEPIEVLLVVVPNRIIDKYTEIAEYAGLEFSFLEAEVFALQRALLREDKYKKDVVCLIDIGSQSTTCSIIDNNVLRVSNSFDIAAKDFTEMIAKSFNIGHVEANILKENQGLTGKNGEVKELLEPVLGMITNKIKKVFNAFYETEGKEVQHCILAGGSALMPGLREYFTEVLEIEVKIAFPFADMVYPPVLENELYQIGPGFTIATGMALRGL